MSIEAVILLVGAFSGVLILSTLSRSAVSSSTLLDQYDRLLRRARDERRAMLQELLEERGEKL